MRTSSYDSLFFFLPKLNLDWFLATSLNLQFKGQLRELILLIWVHSKHALHKLILIYKPVFDSRPGDVEQLISEYHWQAQIFYKGELVNFWLVDFARLLASKWEEGKKLAEVRRNYFF